MLPYINIPFQYVAGAVGASVDEVKLLFLFFFSYPLAAILKRIPDAYPWQKNVYTICVSLFYLVGLFDLWDGLVTIATDAVVTYLIAQFIGGPFMPWIGFTFLMGHMSVAHIVRQRANDPGSIDITGAQMVMVMKLSAFCWNVYDGRLPDKDLTDHQKERVIRKLPNYLDYAAYVLFFPALMAGPAFDYAEYKSYISSTMFELPPGIDASKAPPTRKQRKIPRSGRISAWKLAEGVVWIVIFLQLSQVYPIEFFYSSDWMKYNFFRRVFQLYMLGIITRTKFYGVWSMAEGACILSGIGYRGIDAKTGKPAWDRLTNVRPVPLESAQNAFEFIGNWNLNTNNWLRNYVYLRVTPKGKKPGARATVATFTTSAFWHGFYPGYYLTFILAAFLQIVARNGRKTIRPFFLTPDGKKATKLKPLYDIVCWFVTQALYAFTVAPFVALTISNSMKIWSGVYFYCIIAVAGSLAFFASPAKAILTKQVKAYQTSASASLEPQERVQRAPTLGVPDDPEQAVDEIITEVKLEIERRKNEGLHIPDVKVLIQERLEELKMPQLEKVASSQPSGKGRKEL